MTDKYIFTTVYEQDSFVPVARIVERQAHLQEQAKINEDKQWQELENYYLGKKHKQRKPPTIPSTGLLDEAR